MITSLLLAATLTWDPLPANCGVVGYNIHYGPIAASPVNHVAVGNVTTSVVQATGANYYTVTGRNSAGKNSKPSNQVLYAQAATPTPSPTATPPAPVVSFSLTWNAVQHAVKYRVYEGTTQIAEQTGTTYSLAGKVGPKSYQVAGVNSAGVAGPKSNTVSLAAPSPTPSPTATPSPSPVPTPAAPVLQLQQL